MELCHGQRASSVLGSGVRSSSKHAPLVPAVVPGARGLPHPASQAAFAQAQAPQARAAARRSARNGAKQLTAASWVPSAVQPAAEAQAVPEQAQAKPQPVVADLETILQERDACGVGFIANLRSIKSHTIVEQALRALGCMEHRGACSADDDSGDGAGLMTQIPWKLLKKELPAINEATTGVGMMFMPNDDALEAQAKAIAEEVVAAEGLSLLGWRQVPVAPEVVGRFAKATQPRIWQMFISGKPGQTGDELERQLFIVRKLIERAKTAAMGAAAEDFYVCTLSNRTIVYKGMLRSVVVGAFYKDLVNADYETAFAIYHRRFSTNTTPKWPLAQPMRILGHNGEINTLQGNLNWIASRQNELEHPVWAGREGQLLPLCNAAESDSANLDHVAELLVRTGFDPQESLMLLVPEAFRNHPDLMKEYPEVVDFYEFYEGLQEGWDGPALLVFSDGKRVGARLDRNGLRPARFWRTADDTIYVASEVGVLGDVMSNAENVVAKGRLGPGQMVCADLETGMFAENAAISKAIATKQPYKEWVEKSVRRLEDMSPVAYPAEAKMDNATLLRLQAANGMGAEDAQMVVEGMAQAGVEPTYCMGDDIPLAVLSDKPHMLYNYFKQRFAQVTNPPIDPLREGLVMSLEMRLGGRGNLLNPGADTYRQVLLNSPILLESQLEAIAKDATLGSKTFDISFKAGAEGSLAAALTKLCSDVEAAVKAGCQCVVLSDRATETNMQPGVVPIPSLLATGAVHHYLIRTGLRSDTSIVVETAQAFSTHHAAMLIGYGAHALCPYLAYETARQWRLSSRTQSLVKSGKVPDISVGDAQKNLKKSLEKGILKILSKMGISLLGCYHGAQIFEAYGLSKEVIDTAFTGSVSRIGGMNLADLQREAESFWAKGFPEKAMSKLEDYGFIQSRAKGEYHANNQTMAKLLHKAIGLGSGSKTDPSAYEAYMAHFESAPPHVLRDMLALESGRTPISVDEVEPAAEIMKRFCTGGMSLGAISRETHETIAVAVNRIGGKSNSGEGGEDPIRWTTLSDADAAGKSATFPYLRGLENGDTATSKIKQVASGRFGVTPEFLVNADQLEIKIAQGAKPGEGGQLPGKKVSPYIANLRRSKPGVPLISPPPHHDIYSIEDLAQLIYDLKSSNPGARVSVKLVSENGVGVVASGVVKGHADHVLISGHDGGTGAAKLTSIKHAGLPWELGLAETHQTLVANDLRGRTVLQADGQMRTGRDIAVAALLGAEEFGFATAPLITLGCIMMRKCHTNTCPVGIATQDPELRAKFQGQPEHVINYFFMVAEEMRKIMADMGFRTVKEMVGRADMLEPDADVFAANPKLQGIDLSRLLTPAAELRPEASQVCIQKQDHGLDAGLDVFLIPHCKPALPDGPGVLEPEPVYLEFGVLNTHRAVGTTLSHEVTKRFGAAGLPDDTIHIKLSGHAGQSLGAWLCKGITIELEGDANDYVGKGLSGGVIAVYPPKGASFKPSENIIIGNVALYGGIKGEAFFRGMAAERFCVRNSGVKAVVEGCGDHGCEYMTGGVAVILGRTGKNFGAGMSGGIAYVYDPEEQLASLANADVKGDLLAVEDYEDVVQLKSLIQRHLKFTGSETARRILLGWDKERLHFKKVFPHEYRRALQEAAAIKKAEEEQKAAIKAAGLEGVDAFERLKQEAAKASIKRPPKALQLPMPTIPDPAIAKAALEVTAREGLPVTGTNAAAWEALRPKVVPETKANKARGFLEYNRQPLGYRPEAERLKDWGEVMENAPTAARADQLHTQSARCMECGTPFCHQINSGCPLGNKIPEFNDLVHKGRWREALDRLLETNNFPEFTGRVCPAPCEGACVLGINQDPVSIKSMEATIIDKAFEEGWMLPRPPKVRTGRRVSIIGSGPAGLAAADQLNKMGHEVTVYERADRIGGLMMYGVPNMKTDKVDVVQRRVNLMAQEGVKFVTGAHVGVNVSPQQLQADSDVLLLAAGATRPRDLPVEGRTFDGVHFAMDFLGANTKSLLDSQLRDGEYISAAGKKVIVIGGGDTGTDCIATSIRHGATSVINLELMDPPPAKRAGNNPWPQWPRIFRVDYGHAEAKYRYGADPRTYNVLTKRFIGDADGKLTGVEIVNVRFEGGKMVELPGSARVLEADMVLLAMGFLGPEATLAESLKLEQDARSNFKAEWGEFATSIPGVFAAGDCRRGQSLVVWAIREGRDAAAAVDRYLEKLPPAAAPSTAVVGGIRSVTEVPEIVVTAEPLTTAAPGAIGWVPPLPVPAGAAAKDMALRN